MIHGFSNLSIEQTIERCSIKQWRTHISNFLHAKLFVYDGKWIIYDFPRSTIFSMDNKTGNQEQLKKQTEKSKREKFEGLLKISNRYKKKSTSTGDAYIGMFI